MKMKKVLVLAAFGLFIEQGNAMNTLNEEASEDLKKKSFVSVYEDEETLDSNSPRGQLLTFVGILNLDEPNKALISLNNKISEVFKNFSDVSNDSIKYEVTEIYQKLGDRLLDIKDFDNAAESYIRSLRLVPDDYNLCCFLKKLNFDCSFVQNLDIDKSINRFKNLKETLSAKLALS